ncbi:MAG TPA: hypothetical protein VE954_34435 [Oligoflexus sp.]|uniref:hypothetical protein n=1 Tax=Oligoflexus sp. TaxID=1971216 RepID=UPI002D418559|nr:hypothetical protein [Oligoflexus sp.]HYX38228.1 hypothetical protein [Oligoflexus sp.]
MKIKIARIVLLICLIDAGLAIAGSTTGSGPPAKEALEEMLMSKDLGSAGLFISDKGDVGLGVNRALDSQIVLTRASFSTQSILISPLDFDALSKSATRLIDAETIGSREATAKSYRVEDSDNADELILKDRRDVARSSVK